MRLCCQDRTGAPVSLAQVLMYGDEVGVVSTSEANNRKGNCTRTWMRWAAG